MANNTLTYMGATYTEREIMSGSYSKSQSLNMAELPVDTVEITVRPTLHRGFETHDPYPLMTADGYMFETTEPMPFSTTFQQNNPLVQYVDGSQTTIWYLQSIDRIGSDIYELNGISSLGRLTQVTHLGGVYGTDPNNTDTVAEVVAEIMANCPGVSYYIAPEFRDIPLYGWLPVATARDNLQQILFAINANLQTDSNGVLRIVNLDTSTQTVINAGSIYADNASVKYETPVTSVVVVEHQYAVGGESKKLFEQSIASAGNETVFFDEPMYNLSYSGGALVASGANYAVIPANTTGTLTGNAYVHLMREISKPVTTATVVNVVRVENATLVGTTASSDVVNRLAAYYACRNAIKVAVAAAFLDPGGMTSIYDPYDEVMRNACIESSQVNLSATVRSSISALVGFTPYQVVAFDDVRVVITSGNSYTFPADIQDGTEVRYVCIGGGDGGGNGGNGGNGGAYSDEIYLVDGQTGGITTAAGAGGAGGIAGNKGAGGKIFRGSMVVNHSQVISLAIGSGGIAGGGLGGATWFDSNQNSSENGQSIESGYIDPITLDVFAVSGVDGVIGGAGGSGGAYGKAGEQGQDLTNGYTGGAGGNNYSYAEHHPEQPAPMQAGGSGGSGASDASNGVNGADGYVELITYWGYLCTSNGVNGVNGSNGAVVNQNKYGCGGNGGSGGSGGSGAGGCYAWLNYNVPGNSIHLKIQASGGTGGIGGAGSAGTQGCVILYYRKPRAS